jgi:TetR/AcrR family transcriptional regulator, transcriptional repressor for nem operon
MAKPNVREQIVQAGMKALIAKGYNGAGVQEIVELAGVPKGSFYNHFESKEALGAEIVERYGQDSPRWLGLRDRSAPALERLRRHFDGLIAFYTGQEYGRGCLLGNFSAELANQSSLIRERLVGLYARWTGDIEAAIGEAQADGSIATKLAPDVLAGFVLDAFEGALLRARVERSAEPFERFKAVVFGQIIL